MLFARRSLSTTFPLPSSRLLDCVPRVLRRTARRSAFQLGQGDGLARQGDLGQRRVHFRAGQSLAASTYNDERTLTLSALADANRPKSEEERRARTLDSKRRWARKNRAERNGRPAEDDGSVDERDMEGWEEEEDEEEWEGEEGRGGSAPVAPLAGQGRGIIYPPSHAEARDKERGRRPSLRSSVSLSSDRKSVV